MKKQTLFVIAATLLIIGSGASTARANGWATAGYVLAGITGADLLFNGPNSLVGRTVAGVGSIFTGRPAYAQPVVYAQPVAYAQPGYGAYYYGAPAPQCREEIRRVPAYDYYGRFMGYFDRRVMVCP